MKYSLDINSSRSSSETRGNRCGRIFRRKTVSKSSNCEGLVMADPFYNNDDGNLDRKQPARQCVHDDTTCFNAVAPNTSGVNQKEIDKREVGGIRCENNFSFPSFFYLEKSQYSQHISSEHSPITENRIPTIAYSADPATQFEGIQSDTPSASPQTAMKSKPSLQQLPRPTSSLPSAITEDICSQLPELIRSHVRDAILQSHWPTEQKLAYKMAFEKNPDLIFKESDPLHFVRYHNYDLLAGAERLCSYWAHRVQLFGPDKAFMPMTLAANGSLDQQDGLAVKTGYACTFPKSTTGQSCILFDRRKLIPGLTTENKLKSLYYLTNQIVSDNPRSAMDASPVLCFIVMVTPRDEEIDWQLMQRVFSAICYVLPIKIQVHLLSIPNRKRISISQELIGKGIKLIQELFNSKISIQVHVQSEPDRILKDLIDLGLTRQGIPLSLGGQWEYDEYFSWCQQRQVLETAMHASANCNFPSVQQVDQPQLLPDYLQNSSSQIMLLDPRNSVTAVASVARVSSETISQDGSESSTSYREARYSRSVSMEQASSSSVAAPSNDEMVAIRTSLSQEDRVAKRRLADLFYSRRKRARKRNEFRSLQQEYKSLLVAQQGLRNEHIRLVRLFSQVERVLGEQLFPYESIKPLFALDGNFLSGTTASAESLAPFTGAGSTEHSPR